MLRFRPERLRGISWLNQLQHSVILKLPCSWTVPVHRIVTPRQEMGVAARLFTLMLFSSWWVEPALAQTDTPPVFADDASIGDLVFIKDAAVAGLTLPGADGGNIDSSNNNGELSDYSFDPAGLPACLNFNRFTRILSGVPTAVIKKTPYTYWAHDDDENYQTSDADTLRFTITVVEGAVQDITTGGQAIEAVPTDLTASFESEYQWFQKENLPELSGVTTWNSVAWKGERIQKQILVNGAASHNDVSIVASDFKSEAGEVILADAVSFRFPQFVIGDIEARNCDGYKERKENVLLSDALFSEQPLGQSVSYPVIIWMSINIPRHVIPGTYSGIVTIGSGSSVQPVGMQVSIQVTPWRIPRVSDWQFHLDLWQFPVSVLDRYNDANPAKQIETWSEEHYALLEPTYRYLAELGQRTVTTYIKEGAFAAPSMVKWIALENGKRWAYDYSVFDAHVERLAAWGIDDQISAFSPIGWNKNEIPFWDQDSGENKVFKVAVGSKIYNALWDHFLTDFKKHLIEKGWWEKTVLYMDEVPEDEMEAVIGLIRHNDKRWKIGLAYGHAPNKRVVGSLYDVSGYYENEKDVETYDHQLTTFYTSCSLKRPNNFVAADANPADLAAIPWYSIARRHDGYLRWAFDNWRSCHPLDLREGVFTAGDFSFVYRSSNEKDMTVIPSVRSELLRDGIEDYEKVRILRNRLMECEEKNLLNSLQEIIDTFSSEALTAGHARELVIQARRQLNEISLSLSPDHCP